MVTNTASEPERPVFFVFDVESIGFLGAAFWVGWIIIDANGAELAGGGSVRGPLDLAYGTSSAHEWVSENVPNNRPAYQAKSLREMRDEFWAHWTAAQEQHQAFLAADCPWPVEAKFLLECLADSPARRFPYPLIDVASVRLAAGLDPIADEERKIGELPRHSPEADATQSARLLIEALDRSSFSRECLDRCLAGEPERPLGHPHRQHTIRLRRLQKELAAEIDWFQAHGLSEDAYPPEDPPPLDETHS